MGRRCAKNEQPRIAAGAECLRGERAGKTHRAGQRLGRDVSSSRRDACIPTSARHADRPSDRAPRVWAYCVGTSERGVPGRRVVVRCCARRARKKGSCISLAQAWPRGERRRRRDHRNAQNGVRYRRPPRLPGRPRPSRSSPRRAAPSWSSQARAWAKEFDEEYIKKNAPVETVDDGGLASQCVPGAPHFARENLLHIHRARARIVRHSRISATLAPLSRSPRDEKRRVRPLIRAPPTAHPPRPLHVAEDKEKDPATYNILVKKTGP